VLGLTLVLSPVTVAWGVATPTSMERLVQAVREGQGTSESSSSAGLFDEVVFSPAESVAFQVTQIQPLFLGGFGAAGDGGIAEIATAVFNVTFSLAVPHTFALEGGLFANESTAEASFSLIGPGKNLVFSDAPDDLDTSTNFSESGVLAPGSYNVFVIANGFAGPSVSFASWSFTLHLTDPAAVPEPLTSILLALGAVPLAWRGVRRVTRSPRRP
jgi:hypothetical protein